GFDRAWTSIRDSNLSTLIIAGVLYAFGTSFGAGTVRGFAVTLALGLIINLFTAITVTRTFLHFLLIPVKDDVIERQPGLMGLYGGSRLFTNFVRRRRIYYLISAVVITLGIIAMIYSTIRYGSPVRLSIDFRGGSLFVVEFEDEASETAIREVY